MKRGTSFNRDNVIRDAERLPAGGYVVRIINAKEETFDWGSRLAIAFDIEEGEYKGFYKRNFDAQQSEDKKWKGTYRLNIPKEDGSKEDEWTQKKFNTVMVNIEESNPGFYFDWDESKLKGKLIGVLFNNKEWSINGKTGFFTNPHSIVTVETIRSGKFTVPADTLLSGSKASAPTTDSNGFMALPSGAEEEIPF